MDGFFLKLGVCIGACEMSIEVQKNKQTSEFSMICPLTKNSNSPDVSEDAKSWINCENSFWLVLAFAII